MNLYRVESSVTESYTDYSTPDWLRMRNHSLYVVKYPVVKETLKGNWINTIGRKRWVGNNTRRRFAHPSVSEAYAAFLARRKKQFKILNMQLSDCRNQIELAETAIRNQTFAEPSTYSLH